MDPKIAKQEVLRIYKAWKYFVSKTVFKDYLLSSKDRSPVLVNQANTKNALREKKSKFWGMHVFESKSIRVVDQPIIPKDKLDEHGQTQSM